MDSAWGNERQRVTLALAPQDCWSSSELLYFQERISTFYEARNSQVVVILPQNAATKGSHVVKLIGGGKNTTYSCPEENIQEDFYTCEYVCVHMCASTCANTHTEQDHTVTFQPDLKENTACNGRRSPSWDEVFLLLVSNHLLKNEPLGSGNAPQLETTKKSKQINNPKIRFKLENKNEKSFESILKLAGV